MAAADVTARAFLTAFRELSMEIEHVAMNVPDPVGMAGWYVEHLGMRVAFGMDEPPYTHFLADGPDHVLLEIYNNPTDPAPDYAGQNPLRFHIAFTVDDPAAERDRLTAAGATFVEDVHLDDGSFLVMLRDPWGMPVQLCRRGRPMV